MQESETESDLKIDSVVMPKGQTQKFAVAKRTPRVEPHESDGGLGSALVVLI